jgi:enoyl-[acyl-carrier-protein] reductase (NADH)
MAVEGQVALVTGAGSAEGIGFAIARRLDSGSCEFGLAPRPPCQKVFLYPSEDAGVAQLAEQLFCKEVVCL